MIALLKVLTNFVPAVAVIRKERALFGMIGRKKFEDGFLFFKLNIENYFQKSL